MGGGVRRRGGGGGWLVDRGAGVGDFLFYYFFGWGEGVLDYVVFVYK